MTRAISPALVYAFMWAYTCEWGFPGSSDGKESACNVGDLGSIPGSGRSSGECHSSIMAWKTPWTEEPAYLQSIGSQRVRHHRATYTHIHTCTHTHT